MDGSDEHLITMEMVVFADDRDGALDALGRVMRSVFDRYPWVLAIKGDATGEVPEGWYNDLGDED